MRAIEASPRSIEKLLQGHEFVIPDFQRPYSWGAEECDQLWEDLAAFLDEKSEEDDTYFLGSIVVYPHDNSDKIWSVIDGQQRLTTLLMLIRALFEKAGTKKVLEYRIYKEDADSGEVVRGEPRLESQAQPERGRSDREDFREVMRDGSRDFSRLSDESPFKLNYERLCEHLDEWWAQKTPDEREAVVEKLRHKVVMLPIECADLEDALTLFQTINNRGKPLSDADIFKAKIYGAAGAEKRGNFIERWGEMEDHEDLFRIFMHISRAKDDDTRKEIALRKYMEDKHLASRRGLAGKWEVIMESLELCHWVSTADSTLTDENAAAQEKTYWWGILGAYPNLYWRYPLYVYLHKHAERCDKGIFSLPSEKTEEYISLMRNTARYFFIKGVVYNTLSAVRDTAYRAGAAIECGRDYVGEYEKSIADGKNDRAEFDRKLNESDCGRCRSGLVVLAAFLSDKQNSSEFADFLGQGYDIEHILPRRWRNYGEWDEKSHGAHIGAIGNLIPLEKAINRGAGNEWFPYKQGKYVKSKVQDAKDLVALSHWRPEEVQERQKESVARLLKFFKEFERV